MNRIEKMGREADHYGVEVKLGAFRASHGAGETQCMLTVDKAFAGCSGSSWTEAAKALRGKLMDAVRMLDGMLEDE